MKVRREESIKYKVQQIVDTTPGNVLLRSDFNALGTPSSISRALQSLIKEKKLARLGYGVYAKARISTYTGMAFLNDAPQERKH